MATGGIDRTKAKELLERLEKILAGFSLEDPARKTSKVDYLDGELKKFEKMKIALYDYQSMRGKNLQGNSEKFTHSIDPEEPKDTATNEKLAWVEKQLTSSGVTGCFRDIPFFAKFMYSKTQTDLIAFADPKNQKKLQESSAAYSAFVKELQDSSLDMANFLTYVDNLSKSTKPPKTKSRAEAVLPFLKKVLTVTTAATKSAPASVTWNLDQQKQLDWVVSNLPEAMPADYFNEFKSTDLMKDDDKYKNFKGFCQHAIKKLKDAGFNGLDMAAYTKLGKKYSGSKTVPPEDYYKLHLFHGILMQLPFKPAPSSSQFPDDLYNKLLDDKEIQGLSFDENPLRLDARIKNEKTLAAAIQKRKDDLRKARTIVLDDTTLDETTSGKDTSVSPTAFYSYDRILQFPAKKGTNQVTEVAVNEVNSEYIIPDTVHTFTLGNGTDEKGWDTLSKPDSSGNFPQFKISGMSKKKTFTLKLNPPKSFVNNLVSESDEVFQITADKDDPKEIVIALGDYADVDAFLEKIRLEGIPGKTVFKFVGKNGYQLDAAKLQVIANNNPKATIHNESGKPIAAQKPKGSDGRGSK